MKRKTDYALKQAPRLSFVAPKTEPPLVATLSFVEQLLIWSMRVWMRQGQAGSAKLAMLKDTWRLARAAPILGEFDSCMTLFAITANPPILTGSLTSLSLTTDEARLLAIIQSFQAGDSDQAKRALCARLPCAAVRVGRPAIESLARCLDQTGHRLPSRKWPLIEWDELGQLIMESDRISANSVH